MSALPYIAANRFGLGFSREDLDRIGNDPQDWINRQLRQSAASSQTYNLPSLAELTSKIAETRMARKQKDDPAERRRVLRESRQIVQKGYKARLDVQCQSKDPLLERLVMFWSNHFTVSTKGKPYMGLLACSLERDAIRPHILGRFEDMLMAVSKHPAMLVYLDNVASRGPDSLAGKKQGKGLNENLAREILELHTLGVDGGYTQADVIAFAKILTGWTIDPPQRGGNGGFRFFKVFHQPGAQTLLGKTYAAGGVEQGEAVLRDLAHHPATAQFIATKLIRHFVDDVPRQDEVTRVAAVFTRTEGDLRAVMSEVAALPRAWSQTQNKLKSPYELVVSSLRLAGGSGHPVPFESIYRTLVIFDHVPFTATSPAGWPDDTAGWLSPNAMLNRIEWCHATSRQIPIDQDPLALARDVMGPVASAETLTAIQRAPTAQDGYALLLASPEFQRR